MNTADSNVTAINFHQIIACFSPASVTFEMLFCLFRTWSFTRFTNDLDSTDNSNSASSFPMTSCWGLASSWESISGRPDLSRRVSSFLTDCAVPSRRITSWPNFSYHFPRNFIRSHRSLVCFNVSFTLLRRPSAVVIPRWVACWREAFHKLLMVIVIGSFELVYADIRSPRSLLLLSNWTPGILTSITSLPRAYWSRGWYVRRRPCNKIHHWSRFCCPESCWDRFASVSEHTVELKWLILNKHNKWFHSSRVKFPCRCTWFGFLGPGSFDRTTNQEQLCGFCEHVSLWDSSL